MEQYPYEEEMEAAELENESQRHWRMFFEYNDGGVDDKKVFIHANMWDFYVNKKEALIKGGCLVEVVSSDGKKVLWREVDNHFVQEENDYDEIGLWGFGFNLFNEDEDGGLQRRIEVVSLFIYSNEAMSWVL